MQINEETQKKIHDMQHLEQHLQQFLIQRQAFQTELMEIESASEALKNSGDEVYKLIGQLLLKTEKKKTEEELVEKKKLLEMRLKAIEKQESNLIEKLEKIREEVISEMNHVKEKKK